ncbi:MAG: hypothetical protein ACREJ3_01060 [Polyangiaceae bacterium]
MTPRVPPTPEASPLERAELAGEAFDPATWAAVEDLICGIEELQRQKVIALARRIKPGLTLEDVRNPHDFPELSDPDWQYEDGALTGIQSVLSALRATRRSREQGEPR